MQIFVCLHLKIECVTVKACVYYLFFQQMIAFKKYEKCFLFYLKCSFRSQDIQIFVFPFPPLLLPVGHCFSGWLKINLKVYDLLNCLNKNLITLKLCP